MDWDKECFRIMSAWTWTIKRCTISVEETFDAETANVVCVDMRKVLPSYAT